MYKAHSQLTTHLHLLLGCQLCWRLAQDHLHSWAGCRHHEAHATQGLAGLLVAQEQQQLPCAAHVAGLQADLQRRVLIQYALRATSKGKRRAVTVTCLQHHLMPITQTQACKGRAEHQPNCNSPPMLPPPTFSLVRSVLYHCCTSPSTRQSSAGANAASSNPIEPAAAGG